jgi:hypothetical protein
LKIPNGVFAGNNLPNDLIGEHQKPDYLWPINHSFMGDHWTVGIKLKIWCDCVGEGKPKKVPEGNTNDHALNQIIMSAMACIYHQISLGKEEPRVLAFTLNQKIVRFFAVTGQKNSAGNWKVTYFHVKDRNLDLSITGDCVRCMTLAKVLRERDLEKQTEFVQLMTQRQAEGVDNMVQWWVDKKRGVKQKQEEPLAGESRKDDDRNEDGKRSGPGGGSGRDDGDGEKRGDKKWKGDDDSGSQSHGIGFLGKGKTRGLSKVISKLKKLTVSVSPINQ